MSSSSANSQQSKKRQIDVVDGDLDDAAAAAIADSGSTAKKRKQEDGSRAYCFTKHFNHGLKYAEGSVHLPDAEWIVEGKRFSGPVLPLDMCNIDKIGVVTLKEGFLEFEPLELHENMCFLTYQLERCPDSGRPHYQGYFELKKRERITAIIKYFPCHMEPRRATPKQAIDYCHESETRIGDGQSLTIGTQIRTGVSYKFDEVIKAIDEGQDVDAVDSPFRLEYCKKMFIFDALLARRRKPSKAQCSASIAAPSLTSLRVWQQAIVDQIKLPPPARVVVWVTDRKGGRGKTSLTRHLVDEYGALALGHTEMSNCAYTWSTVYGKCNIVIFDITRAEGMQGAYSCAIMERLKDGIMNNTKYQSGMLRFPPPHVLVFSNFMPDVNRLSLDRWRIFELDDSEELIDVTDATLAAAAAAPAVYNAFPAAAASAVPAQNAQWPGFASS